MTGPADRETARGRRRPIVGAGWLRTADRGRLGVILVTYGAIGLLLIVLTLVVVAGSLGAVVDVGATIERERDALVGSLDATGTALADLDRVTGDVGANMVTGAGAARDAAQLTNELAGAMDGLAAASGVSFLGSRPFADLGDRFTQVGSRSRTLSASLESLAVTMDRDVTDLATVRSSMMAARLEVINLRSLVAGSGADGRLLALSASRLILIGLLLWLATQAAVSLVAGSLLLRPSLRRPFRLRR